MKRKSQSQQKSQQRLHKGQKRRLGRWWAAATLASLFVAWLAARPMSLYLQHDRIFAPYGSWILWSYTGFAAFVFFCVGIYIFTKGQDKSKEGVNWRWWLSVIMASVSMALVAVVPMVLYTYLQGVLGSYKDVVLPGYQAFAAFVWFCLSINFLTKGIEQVAYDLSCMAVAAKEIDGIRQGLEQQNDIAARFQADPADLEETRVMGVVPQEQEAAVI